MRKISPPPTGIRSPDRPGRSESLYRLSCPGPSHILPLGSKHYALCFQQMKCVNQTFSFEATHSSSFGWCKEILHTNWISKLPEMWLASCALCELWSSRSGAAHDSTMPDYDTASWSDHTQTFRTNVLPSSSKQYVPKRLDPIKPDPHIACRSNAEPMPFPCHAVPLRV